MRNIPDGVDYLRLVLNPKKETQQTRLNSLEIVVAVACRDLQLNSCLLLTLPGRGGS